MTTPGPEQPLPSDISKLPLKSWDKGVFSSELVKLHIVPSVDIIGLDKRIAESEVGPGHVEEVGTSRNTFCSSWPSLDHEIRMRNTGSMQTSRTLFKVRCTSERSNANPGFTTGHLWRDAASVDRDV